MMLNKKKTLKDQLRCKVDVKPANKYRHSTATLNEQSLIAVKNTNLKGILEISAYFRDNENIFFLHLIKVK